MALANLRRLLPLRLSPAANANANARWWRCFHHGPRYDLKVGIPEFLRGVGRGVEAHAAKLEAEIGDLPTLLHTRTLRLKKLAIPCNHRKLILNYAHKYRLGLWKPRADPPKP